MDIPGVERKAMVSGSVRVKPFFAGVFPASFQARMRSISSGTEVAAAGSSVAGAKLPRSASRGGGGARSGASAARGARGARRPGRDRRARVRRGGGGRRGGRVRLRADGVAKDHRIVALRERRG